MKKIKTSLYDWCEENDKKNLIEEFDNDKNDLSPKQISFGSTKKVWWKCLNNHSWLISPNNRTSQKSGCPYCSNKKVLEGYNDLAIINPKIASEWHPTKNGDLKPNQVSYGSNKRVWWKCYKCGYEWKTDITHRVSSNSGCAVCANVITLKGYNDLATLHPELLKEWDYEKNKINPSDISSSYKKKVYWICPNKHKYETSVVSRAIMGTNCPICANQKANPGVNDLITKNPELASQFDLEKNTINIKTLMPNSNLKVWWKCKKYNHSWQATVYDRTNGKGCPVCSNKKILKGFKETEAINIDWQITELPSEISTLPIRTNVRVMLEYSQVTNNMWKSIFQIEDLPAEVERID